MVIDPQLDSESESDAPEAITSPAAPPLQLREPLPDVIGSQSELTAAVHRLRAGNGPIAIDTERASGYRYGQRAYLIQIRREGSGTILVDPIAVPDLADLATVLAGDEWILHAASQDLPCLAELGLRPKILFDTELAGRLLGLARVGLGPMVEEVLGFSLAKGHGASDWSKRPLPESWLEYAALDVEVLIELREELVGRLGASGKLEWALEEFAAVRDARAPLPRAEPWRRTSGVHRIRTRRGLSLVAHLWQARDEVAREQDVAPGRLLPDSSVIAAALAQPKDSAGLRQLRDFHGRGARRFESRWVAALRAAWAAPDADLPEIAAHAGDAPPAPRLWTQRDPIAAARLEAARLAISEASKALSLPVENLLTPEIMRRLLWAPPPEALLGDALAVADYLSASGARKWQVELTAELLAAAMVPANS